MENERWEQVKTLCLGALEREESARPLYLQQVCGDDEGLRRELESLLAYQDDARDFLEFPPLKLALRLLPGSKPVDSPLESGVDLDLNPDPMVGRQISHYRIVEKLGAGGMGVVYKAEDTKLNRFVALKFFTGSASSPIWSAETEYSSRAFHLLESEARASSALDHPNICTVYEVNQHDDSPFIAMQFLAGKTLKQQINGASLPVGQAIDLGIQVADALDAAHASGIVHRDIKSANIFVTQRSEAKILDFGLAKLASHRATTVQPVKKIGSSQTYTDSSEPGSGPNKDCLASGAGAFGTACYMSPEQIRSEPIDARTDLFSLGVVLYEMATGKLPFVGETRQQVFENILHYRPPSPATLNPALPEKFAKIIDKAIEKDREGRYQTAGELRDDLRHMQWSSLRPVSKTITQNKKKRWQILAIIALVLAGSLSLYLYRHRTPVLLGAGDTIVLADFYNATGDPVFDEALKLALRIELEQSPFLQLLSDQKVAEQLRYMGRPGNTRVSPDVARELCLRSGAKAVVEGSILGIGNRYLLNINATNCRTGDFIAIEHIEAEGRDAVLPALGRASTRLRTRLGESLASISEHDAPIEQATTSSLEALRSYSLGVTTRYAQGDKAALPLFERAASLDPNFAMAYARAGAAYANLDRPAQAVKALQRAHDLRDRVSEAERLYIDYRYFSTVTGELDKTVQVLKVWGQTYPRDFLSHLALGHIYNTMGQPEIGIQEDVEALRLEPGNGLAYANLTGAYLMAGQFDQAWTTLQQAQTRGVTVPLQILFLYEMAFLRADAAEMQRQFAAAMGKPGLESAMLAFSADSEAYAGHLARAREVSRRAADSAIREGSLDEAEGFLIVEAMRYADFGNRPLARRVLSDALALNPKGAHTPVEALALALAGEDQTALTVAHVLSRQSPLDTLLNDYWLPTIRATVELNRHRPAKAVELLQTAIPYEGGIPEVPTHGYFYPVYIRGVALLQSGNGAAAASEFRKILDHSCQVANYPLGALAHLGLARSYALFALNSPTAREQSRTAYRDFLALWKDADHDIPIRKQAETEYAKLR